MNEPSERSVPGDNPIDEIIADFLEATERGEAPDPQAYLDRHPQFASELKNFFQAASLFHHVAREALNAIPQVPAAAQCSRPPSAADTPTITFDDSSGGASKEKPPAGDRFGEYDLLQEIARGGMGVIYKGRDTDLKREIAVKILLQHHQGELELRQRFVEEAQIAGQLQHPGITPVYELGIVPDGRPYFTMKLVKGETLAKLLAARPNPQEDRPRFLKIFEQICQTLAYAHSRGVIHRDLKPSNIMVGAFGEVQVMDWGLAKVLAEGREPQTPTPNISVIRTARSNGADNAAGSGSQTQFGSVLGTLAYMAPEQAIGERLDQRADVFGLGAILCEILTGRPPYVATSFEQLRRLAVRAELTEAFDSLDHCGADQELIRLARHALATESENRPADAGVLSRELTDYREGVEARLRQAELAEVQATTRAIEERHRRKLTLAFSGALLTVLAIGVISTTWGMFRAGRALRAENQAKERLRHELYVADLQLANQMWESSNGTAKNVSDLLTRQIPTEGQTDLREFAWRLQSTAINRNSLVLKGHGHGARLVAFDSSGHLVTFDGDLTLRRWKIPEGIILSETELKGASQVSCWSISADARWVALGAANRVHVFDIQSGEKLHSFTWRALSLGLSFSTDGRQLATVWGDGRVQIWQTTTGQESASLVVQHPEQLASEIELAPDGQSVFLLDYPDSGQITRLKVGQTELLLPTRHRSWVFCIALSADGKLRATGDSNGYVYLSNEVADNEHNPPLRVHRGAVSSLAFSADGRRLATGGSDGSVTIWDVARREQVLSFKGHHGRIRTLSFAPDGLTVASASDDGTSRVWNLLPDRASHVFGARERPVFSMAYSPDGRRLAVGTGSAAASPDGFVEVWDVPSGELLNTFRAADGRVLALAYSPDGSRLITGGYDSYLRVWDAATGIELTGSKLPVMPGLVSEPARHFRQLAIGSVAVSPDGMYVVAGFGHPTFYQADYEQVAKVWELATGKLVAVLSGHSNSICEVTFSRDGKLLATASDDQLVKLWSVKNWQPVGHPLKGSERFKGVAFSADGQWVVAGGDSGVITIWESAGGRLVNQLRGHADAVQRLVFSPDGRTLATASWDNTIKLWDPVTGRETRTLRDHDDWISCLAFAPDGNTLATGSFDTKVRLWAAASVREISAIVTNDRAIADRLEVRHRDQRKERATRKILPMTSKHLETYSGAYENGLTIETEAGHLTIRPIEGEAGARVRLYPQSETEFFARDCDVDVIFLNDDAGQVARAIIYRDGAAHEVRRNDLVHQGHE